MAREFARKFYASKEWLDCRASYISKARGLCELCLKRGLYRPGVIVHHKVWLNPNNIECPEVTLNHDNLLLVCRECHERIHTERERRYTVGADGRIAPRI